MTNYAFRSVAGKRNKNEDSFGRVGEKFFLVADGMGGHPFGEVASRIAVETAKDLFQESSFQNLGDLFQKVNQEIIKKTKEDPSKRGMGTTLNSLWVKTGGEAIFANVGDSRSYLISSGKIIQVSQDDRDSFGALTQALGVFESTPPHTREVGIKKGDVALLCSDGLSDFADDGEIEEIVSSGSSLGEAANKLIDLALGHGSSDNITVCLVKI